MMIKRTAVLVFLLLGGVVTLGAADQPKLRSSGSGDPAGVRQFAVTMTPVRARLISSDPRVSAVAEVPSTVNYGRKSC